MQEGQVTIEGRRFALPAPFMVVATQNPIEQEGTYPLPEAQLDRFLIKVVIGYPGLEDERCMVARVIDGQVAADHDVSQQTGRAWWRARVCQSVYSPVGAVP